MTYINFIEISRQFVTSTETCFVMEGQTATLSCETNAPEDVKWYRDGEEISPSDRVHIFHDGRSHHLIIHDTTLYDQAEYFAKFEDKEVATRLVVEGMNF